MTGDYITPAERLNPRRARLFAFISELWWRYRWRCDRWEYLKAKRAKAYEIAISWVESMEDCERKLAQLGVRPSEVESIQRSFEVWLIIAIVIGFGVLGFVFSAYRETLVSMVQGAM